MESRLIESHFVNICLVLRYMLVFATVRDAINKLQDEKDDPFLQNYFSSTASSAHQKSANAHNVVGEDKRRNRRERQEQHFIGPKAEPAFHDLSKKYSMWI